jgi:hypothetical protein
MPAPGVATRAVSIRPWRDCDTMSGKDEGAVIA